MFVAIFAEREQIPTPPKKKINLIFNHFTTSS